MSYLMLSPPGGVSSGLTEILDRYLCRVIQPYKESTLAGTTHSAAGEIRQLHQQILSDHQKTWFQIQNRTNHKLGNDRYTDAIRIIAETLGNKEEWVIADPLLCFFSSLWEQQMDRPIYLLYYTEPVQTAIRLQEKWRFPIKFGLALWEYYVCNALHHIADKRFVLISSQKLKVSPVG